MAKDKLIIHRFMSREEYNGYKSGEVLHNDTDHYRDGKGGSTSKGFCFFIGNVGEWAHKLNGLVTFEVLLTVEVDFDNTDADICISTGMYADNPSAEYPRRKPFREVCTTAYSKQSMRFISADFSWGYNPRFYSKDQCMKMILCRIPPIVKHNACQYPNI